jgi:NitT/TauT family transport system permease protein
MVNKLKRLFQSAVLLFFVALIYEIMAIRVDNPVLLPRIGLILPHLFYFFSDVVGTGSMAFNLLVTVLRMTVGLILSAAVAIPLGLFMGMSPLVRRIVAPLVELLRPICPCAWLPFALIIFKTNTLVTLSGVRYTNTILDELNLAMIFIVFLGGFFPILLDTIHGASTVRRVHIESALMMGTRGSKMFRKVIFPSAIPSIIQGVRIGIGVAWMTVVVGEMLPGSEAGIGHLIMFAFEIAETDILVAGMIVIGLTGLLLNSALNLTNSFCCWQAKEV